jgi:hypothetical protein
MKNVLYILTAMAVIGLAFWAYRENYRTQAELDHLEKLQREVGAAHTRLNMLRAEWAYLNRPDRLRELADLNFDRLGLLPLRADQFGRVDQVAFPQPEPLPITNPVEVMNRTDLAADGEGQP